MALSDQDRAEVQRIAREAANARVADDFPRTRQELLDFLAEQLPFLKKLLGL